MLSAIRGNHHNRQFERIKKLLGNRPELARAIFEAAIDSFAPAFLHWRFSYRLRECLPFSLSAEPLRWLTDRLMAGIANSKKRDALYELAFSWVYPTPEENLRIFESLYHLAEGEVGKTCAGIGGDRLHDLLIAARDQFDRVGDNLTANQGGSHAFCAHRDAVRDRYGVKLQRGSARSADALTDMLCKLAEVIIARTDFYPGVRDADQGFTEIIVIQAGGA